MRIAHPERLFILGDVLHAEKARHRRTWSDLVTVTGVCKPSLHLFATGQHRAPEPVIAALEAALKLPPGALVAPDQQAARQRAITIRLQKLERQRQFLTESAARAT